MTVPKGYSYSNSESKTFENTIHAPNPRARSLLDGNGKEGLTLGTNRPLTPSTYTSQNSNLGMFINRPQSEILGLKYQNPEAEAIDKLFEDLSYYEQSLIQMASTKMDSAFQEELKAMTSWFTMLSDAERTTTVYSLIQHLNALQMRFFITNLQQQLAQKEADSYKNVRASNLKKLTPRFATVQPPFSFYNESDSFSDILGNSSSTTSPVGSLGLNIGASGNTNGSIGSIGGNSLSNNLNGGLSNNLNGGLSNNLNSGLSNNLNSGLSGLNLNNLNNGSLSNSALSSPSLNNLSAVSVKSSYSFLDDASMRIKDVFKGTGSEEYEKFESKESTGRERSISFGGIGESKERFAKSSSPSFFNNSLGLGYYDGSNKEKQDISSYLDAHSYLADKKSREKGKIPDAIKLEDLSDIPAWLRGLRLHKYTPIFENMNWRDMIELNDAQLENLGVAALGARRKMLKVFEKVKQDFGIEE